MVYIFKNWSKSSGLSYGDSQSIIQAEKKLVEYQELCESIQVNSLFRNFTLFHKFSFFTNFENFRFCSQFGVLFAIPDFFPFRIFFLISGFFEPPFFRFQIFCRILDFFFRFRFFSKFEIFSKYSFSSPIDMRRPKIGCNLTVHVILVTV